ncbi:IS200/IS605 family transposase [Desulfovibrio sp. SGI.169]|uniref:IS200/IS605 family transposase n=1 Tax=Desulfovibrio sp. SGI.169 TaxID=3420561 RepID=UPI003D01EA3A
MCETFLTLPYRKGSHSVFSIHLHLVWITKYRKKILSGDIAQRGRSLLRGIYEKYQVEILKRHMVPDHIHRFVSIPPNLAAVSGLMRQLEGRTSRP